MVSDWYRIELKPITVDFQQIGFFEESFRFPLVDRIVGTETNQ